MRWCQPRRGPGCRSSRHDGVAGGVGGIVRVTGLTFRWILSIRRTGSTGSGRAGVTGVQGAGRGIRGPSGRPAGVLAVREWDRAWPGGEAGGDGPGRIRVLAGDHCRRAGDCRCCVGELAPAMRQRGRGTADRARAGSALAGTGATALPGRAPPARGPATARTDGAPDPTRQPGLSGRPGRRYAGAVPTAQPRRRRGNHGAAPRPLAPARTEPRHSHHGARKQRIRD